MTVIWLSSMCVCVWASAVSADSRKSPKVQKLPISSSTYISCWALKSKYHRPWRHWGSLWSLQPLFLARKFSFFESHEDWWIYINECERPAGQLLWNIRRNLSMIITDIVSIWWLSWTAGGSWGRYRCWGLTQILEAISHLEWSVTDFNNTGHAGQLRTACFVKLALIEFADLEKRLDSVFTRVCNVQGWEAPAVQWSLGVFFVESSDLPHWHCDMHPSRDIQRLLVLNTSTHILPRQSKMPSKKT